MQIWMKFLSDPLIFCRPFLDCFEQTAADIDMYSDASGSKIKGFGAYCGQQWVAQAWDKIWFERENPSIEYLELYAVTTAVILWLKKFKNTRILLPCYNESVCKMINKSSAGCKNCMVLLRIIVLESLRLNTKITAEWMATGDNGKADALSRLEFDRFWDLADEDNMNQEPHELPDELWPVAKIWVK